jgi:hypothetical protein
MNQLPRHFFRQIGEKGGRAGKFSYAKRESARYAAKVRWARYRSMQKAVQNQQT